MLPSALRPPLTRHPLEPLALAAITFLVVAPTPHSSPLKRPTPESQAVYASASKTVVTIIVMDQRRQKIATGSGVIFSPDGKIVTNQHVVSGGAFFDVRLPADAAGKIVTVPARPFACSPNVDLAILIIAPPAGPLRYARMTMSLNIGDHVFAIGSPFGLEGTLSEGVVSQIRKQGGRRLIQTTAAISPGSSGGGLFLATGELVGITEMFIEGGQSLNFAIEIAAVSNVTYCDSFPSNSPTPKPFDER
jgi:S1-C subfamily serine protease